mgnify:CR=1 FL=1
MNTAESWRKSDSSKELYNLLEVILFATIMLSPFIPRQLIRYQIHLGFKILSPYKTSIGEHTEHNIIEAPILFKKIWE